MVRTNENSKQQTTSKKLNIIANTYIGFNLVKISILYVIFQFGETSISLSRTTKSLLCFKTSKCIILFILQLNQISRSIQQK